MLAGSCDARGRPAFRMSDRVGPLEGQALICVGAEILKDVVKVQERLPPRLARNVGDMVDNQVFQIWLSPAFPHLVRQADEQLVESLRLGGQVARSCRMLPAR